MVAMVAGCPADEGDGAEGVSAVDETGDTDDVNTSEPDEPDEPDDSEQPDEPDDSQEPDEPADALAECRKLPGAEDWIEGEAPESTAESTPQRIAAAGAETWSVALDLLRAVSSADAPSVVASPASMVTALGLSYGRWQSGSCGDRIAEVMRFAEREDDLHHTLGASIEALQSRAMPATDNADPVILSMQQSTWAFGDTTLPELSELESIYAAKPNAMLQPGEPARDLINCIIEAESDGLLPDFLPMGQPAADTSSYDVNVSVLKAPWAVGMTPQSVSFTFADGSTDILDGFGTTLVGAQIYEGEAFSTVDIALRGGAVSVMIVIPPEDYTDGLDAFAASLEADTLRAARDEAMYADIEFAMPKVVIESSTVNYYEPLGFECEPFTLRSVFHGAALELDEKGIKAAAATVAEGFDDDGGGASTSVSVDRPFLFFVHDIETEFVLFSGRFSPE